MIVTKDFPRLCDSLLAHRADTLRLELPYPTHFSCLLVFPSPNNRFLTTASSLIFVVLENINCLSKNSQLSSSLFVISYHFYYHNNLFFLFFSKAWRELGSLSRDEAMASFVFLVDRVCPPFKGFISDKKAM